MTGTKPLYKHTFRERKAILEAALLMIKEGRFQHSIMSEIAFHARLTESTALQFFPSRVKLAEELETYVKSEVAIVVSAEIELSSEAMIQFQNASIALYKFYLRNPGVFKFIDQASITLSNSEAVRQFHKELNKPIEKIIETTALRFPNDVSAAIAHNNILGLAKIAFEQHVILSKEELKKFSASLWRTLTKK
jgi:hypothetical protein